MKKAETRAVEETTLDCDFCCEARPAFVTVDSLDGAVMHVVQHEDMDVSIFFDFDGDETRQVAMSPEQAKEFFTLALTLC